MAKLSSYYTLCPLIDQQNLLGVERDSEPGCAIVTLGRNIVIRYKLQDLKQISSWSSKERLTTQVIYNQLTSEYVAVFNGKKVRVWSKEETDLNNVKGYKFSFPFHTILTQGDSPPVLVQQNGATARLDWALNNRKNWSNEGFLKSNEKLLHCQLINTNNEMSLCALTKVEKTHYYIVIKLRSEDCWGMKESMKRLELKRTSEELVSHVIMQSKDSAYLLTLWSHGRLYSHPLTGTQSDTDPSKLISVMTNINTKHSVVMTALNETTIAVYGADISEEGAILMIYNLQFKLVQAIQKLKLYTKDAKLWKVEDKLLLAANRHLAVAPFHLAPQRIEAMLGSSSRSTGDNSKNEEDEIMVIQESTIANWTEAKPESKPRFSIGKIPKHVSKQINSHMNEGLSDAAIQRILIPQLIESKDVKTIIWCLDSFKDLPEKLLADLLIFCLRSPEKTFVPLQNGHSKEDLKNSSIYSRKKFLDKIFSMNHTEMFLLSFLKICLKFDEVIKLMEYLIEKLKTQEVDEEFTEGPSEKQLYDWTSLLLDSHYQQLISSQDCAVLSHLNNLKSVLDDHFQLLQNLENLRPMMNRTLEGKPWKLSVKDCNKFYSIEEIKLY